MKSMIAVAGILAAMLMAPASSLACSVLGPNKHVGTVISLDSAAQTITVLDAQSNQPITFLADEKIISEAGGAIGRIVVDYVAEGAQLRAIGIQY